jgi:hypothetical protein
MRRPSAFRIARWPPLRSAAVRRHSSAAYGAPEAANQPAIRASGAAPRLSAFDEQAYRNPWSRSASRTPDDSSDG